MPIFALRASSLRIKSAGSLRLYLCILDFIRTLIHLYIHECQEQSARSMTIYSARMVLALLAFMFNLEGMPPKLDEMDRIYLWGVQVLGEKTCLRRYVERYGDGARAIANPLDLQPIARELVILPARASA
jgi:hypothetical protein